MLRLGFVCFISLPWIIYYLCKAGYIEKHPNYYTEKRRYRIARHIATLVRVTGFIRTRVYGAEHLPTEGGYVMYANHQGKYDTLGIISGHEAPCTMVIDEQRSHLIIADQFTTLLKGSRLDKTNMKAQMSTILKVIEEVKNGRRYIIFPEGGYDHNHNNIQEFLPGAFKCSLKSKTPIVPVVLVDSYKPFEFNSLMPVTTQVHFLEPIPYESYKDMTSKEVADMVKDRIAATLQEVCSA